jgi:hypothetical protein
MRSIVSACRSSRVTGQAACRQRALVLRQAAGARAQLLRQRLLRQLQQEKTVCARAWWARCCRKQAHGMRVRPDALRHLQLHARNLQRLRALPRHRVLQAHTAAVSVQRRTARGVSVCPMSGASARACVPSAHMARPCPRPSRGILRGGARRRRAARGGEVMSPQGWPRPRRAAAPKPKPPVARGAPTRSLKPSTVTVCGCKPARREPNDAGTAPRESSGPRKQRPRVLLAPCP